MSIKANELRIGNWVRIYTTDNPRDDKIETVYKIEEDAINGWIFYHPIPLTEEWALKIDEIWGGDYQLFFNTDDNHLYSDSNFAMCNRLSWDKLEYVHQFQNLVFALTNKELKINDQNKTKHTNKQ